MKFSPCGMVMDWIASAYKVQMRLSEDSDELTWVRWYRADPGAEVFPGPHRFGSLRWEELDAEGKPHLFVPNDGLGEQLPRVEVWDAGVNKNGLAGTHFCGPEEAFYSGATADMPTLEVDANGVPLCCRAPVVTPGGQQEGSVPAEPE